MKTSHVVKGKAGTYKVTVDRKEGGWWARVYAGKKRLAGYFVSVPWLQYQLGLDTAENAANTAVEAFENLDTRQDIKVGG